MRSLIKPKAKSKAVPGLLIFMVAAFVLLLGLFFGLVYTMHKRKQALKELIVKDFR